MDRPPFLDLRGERAVPLEPYHIATRQVVLIDRPIAVAGPVVFSSCLILIAVDAAPDADVRVFLALFFGCDPSEVELWSVIANVGVEGRHASLIVDTAVGELGEGRVAFVNCVVDIGSAARAQIAALESDGRLAAS